MTDTELIDAVDKRRLEVCWTPKYLERPGGWYGMQGADPCPNTGELWPTWREAARAAVEWYDAHLEDYT